MKKNRLSFFAALLLCASLNAQHVLPIYEPFDGQIGNLAPQKGWTGNTTAGNAAQVVDYPLTYPGLYATPSTYSVFYGSQPSGGTQALGFAAQTSTVYASFLIQVSSLSLSLANSRYNFGYGSTVTGGTFAGCMYVVPTSTTNFELGFNGTNVQPIASNTTSQSFALNTTIMVVMAYTPGTAGTGTVAAWVNPDAASFGAAEPAPNFSGVAGGNIATVSSVFIRSGSNTNPMTIDELRVGTSWAQVTSHNVVLPVSIAGLSLSTKKNISTISWVSNTEVNLAKYVVLFSNNGTDYKEIGALKAKGSNTNYEFSHLHNEAGFFKVRFVDVDGRFTVSRVLYAAGNTVSVRVGPNPFSNSLFIAGMPAGTNSAVLYNENGASVSKQIIKGSTGILPVSALPTGKYVLRINNSGQTVFSGVFIKAAK